MEKAVTQLGAAVTLLTDKVVNIEFNESVVLTQALLNGSLNGGRPIRST